MPGLNPSGHSQGPGTLSPSDVQRSTCTSKPATALSLLRVAAVLQKIPVLPASPLPWTILSLITELPLVKSMIPNDGPSPEGTTPRIRFPTTDPVALSTTTMPRASLFGCKSLETTPATVL